jgi:hypothetical protein
LCALNETSAVFAASRAVLDSWMILFYILSQEVQCSALLLGLLFMLDEFLFFPVDVRFELAVVANLCIQAGDASKSPCRSLGIQNLY